MMPDTFNNEHLELNSQLREESWKQVIDLIEHYRKNVSQLSVKQELSIQDAEALLSSFQFTTPCAPASVIDFVGKGLSQYRAHSSHPRYFGLFDPRSTTMGIYADALVAGFNPQLASWNHGSFPIAVENHLIQKIGAKLGMKGVMDGTFTSGGAESNQTAILTALNHRFPQIKTKGLRSLPQSPLIYVTSETHHSIKKAASICGLGTEDCVVIPLNSELKMDTAALKAQIKNDQESGRLPFLIVGTAGTTNGGMIDPLNEISALAHEYGLWFHVDGAWGAAAALVPELHGHFSGIEKADSISIDAHKWLSVPMAAGLYLTRHQNILTQTFHITTSYMPPKNNEAQETNPYSHSLQWSRRFIGLKVFMSLAVAGFDGYAKTLAQQTRMGNLLRQKLQKNNWKIINSTPLPVICFTDSVLTSSEALTRIAQKIVESGLAWISTTQIKGQPVLRACISNYQSHESDLDFLLHLLNETRSTLSPLTPERNLYPPEDPLLY